MKAIKKFICLFRHRKHWTATGDFGSEESDYTCGKCYGAWYVNSKTGEIIFPPYKFWQNDDPLCIAEIDEMNNK